MHRLSILSRLSLLDVLFWVAACLSLPVRLVNINQPFILHYFRQSQTALTVWTFLNEGIAPLAYQTPVFGPPWRLPLEFPTFQISAYFVARTGWFSLDAACRLTGLAYFYASAIVLYLVCKRAFGKKEVARWTLLIYLWAPFMFHWSRTCMIDYASVAFALGYLLLLGSWLRNRANPLACAAIACGSLAYLTKITTMAAYIIPVGYLTADYLWSETKACGFKTLIGQRKADLLWALSCLAIPIAAGCAWVIYADQVKMASPLTAPWASSALTSWNYGALSQRLILSNWARIGKTIVTQVLPYGLILLPFFGLVALHRFSKDGRVLFLTALFGAMSAISIFFNLYVVHDYYLIAVTPLLALMAGAGADYIFGSGTREKPVLVVALAILLAVSLYKGSWLTRQVLAYHGRPDYVQVGLALRHFTHPKERVIVTDYSWNSSILYYARRKGFMYDRAHKEFPYRFLKENGFSTIVCMKEDPTVFSHWKNKTLVATVDNFKIYKVSDDNQ